MNRPTCFAMILIVLAGCRGAPAVSGATDGGPDAGVTDGGVDGGPDAGPPPATATSQVLSGEFVFHPYPPTEPGEKLTLHLQLYFPEGRHAGAPYVLATTGEVPMRGSDRPIGVVSGVLDNTAGAEGIRLADPGYCFNYTGALVGPDEGFHVEVHWNQFCGGDVVDDTSDQGWMRVSEQPAPVGGFQTVNQGFVPTSAIAFHSSVPIDESTAGTFVVMAGRIEVQGTIDVRPTQIIFSPTEAFPPNVPVHIQESSFKDAIGRALAHDLIVSPRLATVALTDLSLLTAPPEGALWESAWDAQTPGQLKMERYQGSGLVKLGDPGTATRLQIRLTHSCNSSSPWHVAAVTGSGHVVALTTGCDGEPSEQVVALPEAGPVWLSLLTSGGFWGPSDQMIIDRLAFLP